MRNTRMGDEMIFELATRLGDSDLSKTAAKKDDDKDDKDDKKDKKNGKCPGCGKPAQLCTKEDCKKDKDKDDKDDKKDDKKKDAVMNVISGLSKLASDLDEMGADDASAAVDEALRVIVRNIQKEQLAE